MHSRAYLRCFETLLPIEVAIHIYFIFHVRVRVVIIYQTTFRFASYFFWTRRIVRFDIEEHFLFLWNTSQTVKIGDVAGDRFSNRHRPTSTDKLQKTITYHFPCFCCDLCYTLWHPQLNSWNNHTRSQWDQSPNFEPFHWDHVPPDNNIWEEKGNENKKS